MSNDTTWYCPLLGRQIAEGYCLEINYVRVGLFKPDALRDAMKTTGRTIAEVSDICRRCPNQPLSADDYAVLGVR